MRSIERCNVCYGLQAALEHGLQVDCITSDGLVLNYKEEEEIYLWEMRLAQLVKLKSQRWTPSQWKLQGFQLEHREYPVTRNGVIKHKASKRIPVLLDPGYTLSALQVGK